MTGEDHPPLPHPQAQKTLAAAEAFDVPIGEFGNCSADSVAICPTQATEDDLRAVREVSSSSS
jgi:hypothetical protein